MKGHVGNRAWVLAAAALAVVAAGCGAALTAPSVIVPYSQTDLVVGTGATAAIGNALGVNYIGWLYDPTQPDNKGAQIDANLDPANPSGFALGQGSVIAGW